MPLIVPGMQAGNTSQSDDWAAKLMGKKLGDQHNETVRPLLLRQCIKS